MPQSITIGAFVFGAILVLIALLGGNFKMFGAEVAATISNPFLRFVSFILGVIFLVIAVSGNIDTPTPRPSSFSATAHCSQTGISGYGYSPNAETAEEQAIGNCIHKGGVPNCCANDVRVTQN